MARFRMSGEGCVPDLDPNRLLTGAQAAYLANVSQQAIVNWRSRGKLAVAERDENGRPKYRLGDVVEVERATSKAAGRA